LHDQKFDKGEQVALFSMIKWSSFRLTKTLGSDAESSWDTIAGGQAAEVRCFCAGPIDIVTICMAKPEDLHNTFASFPAVAFIEPEVLTTSFPGQGPCQPSQEPARDGRGEKFARRAIEVRDLID
jgi:hypothetical protein